ncbi:hypothetical protein Mgra_00007033 [Meloidogyne graminicola]|uniref:Uncharacterized protein n=1 Tax=Meloidogyne graminicola TaxID=189291 RepID=A0A8S9ZJK4_9BILA|nr:hypothetical protein Mgra_00007033 [Meloidogyne graminicola]
MYNQLFIKKMASIILFMFIIFLMMFTTNNETMKEKYRKIYAQLPNPIPIYLHLDPCPNCEEWCANNPKFTCNYSCSIWYDWENGGGWEESDLHTPELDHIDERIEREVTSKLNENKSVNYWSNFAIYLHDAYDDIERYPKEVCPAYEKKNFTCKIYSEVYPVCTNDFKPYEQGMEKFCDVVKDCYKKEQDPDGISSKECTKTVLPIPVFKWPSGQIWHMRSGHAKKDLPQYFGIECVDDRLKVNPEKAALIALGLSMKAIREVEKTNVQVRANTELSIEMKSNISDIQEEIRNEKDVNSERYKALEEKLGKALELLANHEKRITKVEYDVELLMNWKAIMESNAEESRKEAKEDEGCVGGGDDDKEGGGRKKRKAPSRGRGRGRGSGGKKGGGKGGIGDALNVVNKVKGVKDEVEKAFKDPKAYVKNKGRQLLKKGLDKGRQFLENTCDAGTAGIGTVTGICEWAADGIENLATQGVNEVCKLVEKGIEAVKEGATKLFNGAKDFIGGLF